MNHITVYTKPNNIYDKYDVSIFNPELNAGMYNAFHHVMLILRLKRNIVDTNTNAFAYTFGFNLGG